MGSWIMVLNVVVYAVVIKALVGFRFPWERIEKAKRSLKKDLSTYKFDINPVTYKGIIETIDSI